MRHLCGIGNDEYLTETIVSTGKLATGVHQGLIKTSPLGSCVAVVVYDKMNKIGGIAHVMLPRSVPLSLNKEENKYAENAIDNLLKDLILIGAKANGLEACLVGGANVLRKNNDTIGDSVLASVISCMDKHGICVKTTSVGGYERRSASLNLSSGCVSYTIGDSINRTLWRFITEE